MQLTNPFQLNESINGLKKIIEIQAIEEKGLSVTSSKINQLIAEYESLITNSDEIKIWEAFCYLIKNTKISIQDIETQQLDLEKFLELEKMNLIFVEGEIRYLNINNLFEKDFFINYFKIDKNMIPMKEDVIEKLSLNDYLKIDFKDKDLFLQRINGLTLQEIGDKKGLTKERVRQRLAKIRKIYLL
ncbi:sigma factor-like helix-turn-helix DNA-binding protein [Streptococcus himalayensis]|uniref:RNA polymerase sigma-70 region 4 domain-containing protein n=1 Tax=Streptococcus himalayensis TaxID=1888195 RepID=A0A917A804_9STRE|nr:sigma factor-like helix-turn-helix DNA-binding protein [Streptococcus himalayensis]GGE34500.1 hypothetical protein GCM10011510_14780 [Streptococcus himalayensis]